MSPRPSARLLPLVYRPALATLVGASRIKLRSPEIGVSPLPEGVVPIKPHPLPRIAFGGAAEHYDTIVIRAST